MVAKARYYVCARHSERQNRQTAESLLRCDGENFSLDKTTMMMRCAEDPCCVYVADDGKLMRFE